ncbi:MAG TPA: hypothetical protein VMT57_05630 [Candidatus Thermoplasmatota archaeon]|nr:hypothetical protein [Candidatus Thermoplasmatota archaeon]
MGRFTALTGHHKLQQPYFRAKIIGGVLIAVGVALLINPTPLFLKFSFAFILIGVFMILLITEQSVPRKISDAQIEGNRQFVKKMTNGLQLKGNAIFLPKSKLLTEERVFIPAKKTETDTPLPFIDDDLVFSLQPDGEVIGIAVPPAGLTLLKEVETQGSFHDSDLENIEEKLQTFVGMDIVRSVTFKKGVDEWKLELEHQEPCCGTETTNPTCNQYPCAACSAVLTAITQASKTKIRILRTIQHGHKTIFHLQIGGRYDRL